MTATATLGFDAGAQHTNQAVVLFGFWAMLAVETSSAVPVLPATVTPGIAAARPVPYWTPAIIMSRPWPATFALTTRRRSRLVPARWGLIRPPRLAIVAATDAICSGVALSVFWPMAADPTAIASFIRLGTVLTLAAGMSGGSLKPNRSAVASSRFAPTLAPSGPNTELQ